MRFTALARTGAVLTGAVLTGAVCTGMVACSDSPTGASLNAKGLLAEVQFGPKAITMALGQTVPLTTKGIDITGDTVTTFDSVWYTTNDASTVTVDNTGRISGVGVTMQGSPTAIAVMARLGKITRTDTVTVAVTPTVVPVTGLHLMSLLTGGRTSIYSIDIVTAIPFDGDTPADGNINVMYSGGTRGALLLAAIDPVAGVILPLWPGPMWVTATANAYGVTLRDSLSYLNLYKSDVYAQIVQGTDAPVQFKIDGIVHSQYFLATGGTITVQNTLGAPATIHFTGPSPIDDVTLAANASTVVTFPTAGHYAWTITQGSNTCTGAIDVGDPQ